MPFELNHHYYQQKYYGKQIGRNKSSASSFNFKQIGSEILKGGFHDGPDSTAGTVGAIAIGFVPIVGQMADIRDTAAAIQDLVESPDAASAIAVGVALLCFIPGADILIRAKRLQKARIVKKANGAKRLKTSYGAAVKKTASDSKKSLKRFIKEDRTSHLAGGRELRARRPGLMKALNKLSEQVGGGKLETLEHAWGKQRYFKAGSTHKMLKYFPEGSWGNKQIKEFSNAGWNLYPMTRSLNSKLGQRKRKLLSLFINGAVYHVAAQEIILTLNALTKAFNEERDE